MPSIPIPEELKEFLRLHKGDLTRYDFDKLYEDLGLVFPYDKVLLYTATLTEAFLEFADIDPINHMCFIPNFYGKCLEETGHNKNKILIPNWIREISEDAFSDCDFLTSVAIPGTVIQVGENAFSSCSNLTEVILEHGIQIIRPEAFQKCKKLEEIILPDSVTQLGAYAFFECPKLRKVKLSNNLKSICVGTFKGASLESIAIPDNVYRISRDAFAYCGNLKSISISESVEVIDTNAFKQCDQLTTVIYEGSASQWKNIFIDRGNKALFNTKIICAKK